MHRLNITLLDAETLGDQPDFSMIEQYGDIDIYSHTPSELVLERLKYKDVVITNKVQITREIIRQSPLLKLICVLATGTNNIDLEACHEYKVQVKNVKSYSTESVAQHTFAMLLSLVNRIPYYRNVVDSGVYEQSNTFTHIGPTIYELYNKTFGIIGLGEIGQRVAQIATSFGMKVVYYSTSGKNEHPQYTRLSLDELLKVADIVSIHAPLNQDTFDLIDTKQLDLMKPTSILINTGRGGIVNEQALAAAINDQKIHAAALDVFVKEPLPIDSPLKKVQDKDRLLLTPHIAWTALEARKRLIDATFTSIKEYASSISNY